MSSLTPFQFATLFHNSTVPAAGASNASPPVSTGPTLSWPTLIIAGLPLEPTREPTRPDDYELSWNDIDESDRNRFRLENAGRCYASHPSYDIILDVYRRVFHSYPYDVQSGYSEPSVDHHSGVFQRDIREAEEDVGIIRSAPPPAPPTLQRANAEPGY